MHWGGRDKLAGLPSCKQPVSTEAMCMNPIPQCPLLGGHPTQPGATIQSPEWLFVFRAKRHQLDSPARMSDDR